MYSSMIFSDISSKNRFFKDSLADFKSSSFCLITRDGLESMSAIPITTHAAATNRTSICEKTIKFII